MDDDPFDFESDILLATSPVVAPKRKKKVLGLDDLLVDHYKEKNRVAERESKLAKTKRSYNSDDEEDGRVAKLSKYVDECHEKMTQLGDEDDVSHWGLQVFGKQKTPPSFAFSELSSCSFFRLCVDHEVNSLVELSTESGETFFEGLLTNGWLLKLVSKCGEVEKSIAKWTFHLMLYSSKEVLRNAAVDFWCAILSLKNEDESPSIKIDWLPRYSELNGALETFGFVFHSPTKDSSDTEMLSGDSEGSEAPQNVRTWIKYVAACSQSRNIHCTFTTSEAEELVVVIICLLLDRQLLGLSVELNECMPALVNFFTDDEWRFSCVQVAKSVASRVPKDMNSLRAVECISVVHGPTKLLRSEIAFRILLGCFDKVEDEEEVVRQLTLINLKDKSCDLFKVYQTLAAMFLMGGKGGDHSPVLGKYQEKAEMFMCSCMGKANHNVQKTPGGLIFRQRWNNLQFVTSASFLLTVYSDHLTAARKNLHCASGSVAPSELLAFAKSQVDYILGNNPRATSYMVGYGNHYPQQVHHRGSSIVSIKVDPSFVSCRGGYATWFSRKASDPNLLTGAIVGGPDAYDNFADQRDNYEQTEPATYNNAPLLGVLARLNAGHSAHNQLLPVEVPLHKPIAVQPKHASPYAGTVK